ncbi:hypothetical protein [Sphingomonas mollis]|uniref:Hemerythrin-like domain-containing protein n=1 Tax=Sphingomonas mollis TaxID=2795726 RepID=A0ABS0XR07_9SPHN|nr:hypothetical protein [Sphingomonas sp. BT553]MBJ6122468.1 hypothetical protein [Sphingomonas sp. BT553]
MEQSSLLDRLHRHQRLAQDILTRGAACIDGGPDIALPAIAGLRAEMGQVLRDYQIFKHEEIFDPAVTSGSPDRIERARAMKIECIGAGESFRTHLVYWQHRDVTAEWEAYKASARLTINQLKRHIGKEEEGITALLTDMSIDA